jgi:hypothetical protein
VYTVHLRCTSLTLSFPCVAEQVEDCLFQLTGERMKPNTTRGPRAPLSYNLSSMRAGIEWFKTTYSCTLSTSLQLHFACKTQAHLYILFRWL